MQSGELPFPVPGLKQSMDICCNGQAAQVCVQRKAPYVLGIGTASRAALLVEDRLPDAVHVPIVVSDQTLDAGEFGEAIARQHCQAANATVRCDGEVSLDELAAWSTDVEVIATGEYLSVLDHVRIETVHTLHLSDRHQEQER